jgi:DNA-directed RNA polymerase subunit RPC12/RpoP
MTPQYKCICCSTSEDVVLALPIEKDGYLTCPHCGSIELKEIKNE